MYENIIAIHNVLKKKTTQLNFQPAQYFKKINKDNFEKKKKKEEEVNFGLKKKEKKTCKKKEETKAKNKTATVKNLHVLEYLLICSFFDR